MKAQDLARGQGKIQVRPLGDLTSIRQLGRRSEFLPDIIFANRYAEPLRRADARG